MAEVQNAQAFQSSPTRTHPPDLLHSPSLSSIASRQLHPPLTAEHLKLKLRLSPLLQVEEALIRKLTPAGSGEHEATQLRVVTGAVVNRPRAIDKELTVNSNFAWVGVFQRMITRNSTDSDLDCTSPDVSTISVHRLFLRFFPSSFCTAGGGGGGGATDR